MLFGTATREIGGSGEAAALWVPRETVSGLLDLYMV